jgi:hypothetical protein
MPQHFIPIRGQMRLDHGANDRPFQLQFNPGVAGIPWTIRFFYFCKKARGT